MGQGAGPEGRYLHRYLRRFHLCRGKADCRAGSCGLCHFVHIAGHRGALSDHAPLRDDRSGNGRRGTCSIPLHAGLSIRRLTARGGCGERRRERPEGGGGIA
ncbi:2Fe-2S iron-sulfur cluster binding domain-containing protein [Chelativorans salis]|uniref:2Fe-2S iron-sulfur cluster binding domain-containing protein n=1 Tax=Chelativorans salis TaxID=2978478 RepID=UPI003CC56581